MKKNILFILVSLLSIPSYSQVQLWGMTSSGGKDNAGVIFSLDGSGNNYKLEYEFQSLDFVNPSPNVPVWASDGMMYGLTTRGGSDDEGVLFQYNPSTLQYTVKFSFKNIAGSQPIFLLQAQDGMLYGLTYSGGAYNQGVLFQYNPGTNTYVKKFDFDQLNGKNVLATLTEASDGMLYGMTREGGDFNTGVLFQYDPVNSIYKKKLDFKFGSLAIQPYSSLIHADGMLYGFLADGGNGSGKLFQYNPATATLTPKVDFDTLSGNFPGRMIQAKDGMLYGTMEKGGLSNKGILFQYNPVTSQFIKKIDFDGTNGEFPAGHLTEAKDGMLYGLTAYGGIEQYGGVLFQYDPSTSILTKKIDLQRKNTQPSGGMIQAPDGMLYGMTTVNYLHGAGIIFRYHPPTADFATVLNTDNKSLNGKVPLGSLMRAKDGMLYGLSSRGGIKDSGTIFQFDPITHSYSKKFDFNNKNGGYPHGSLIQARDGMMYGLTSLGGLTGYGTLFQYNPANSDYTKKFDFGTVNESGIVPYGSLMQSKNGLLYGMTSMLGEGDAGALFQYDLSNSALTVKYAFTSDDNSGSHPQGSLIEASDGTLYGLTSSSQQWGIGDGSIFQFDPADAAYMLKFSLEDPLSVINPSGSLIQAKDGMFYGMTKEEGKKMGFLFQFNPVTSVFTKKFEFDNINGSRPIGSLMQASNGMLYGMTSKGGAYDLGVLFQYDPSTSTLTKKMDFNGSNGAHPTGDLIEISASVGIRENNFSDAVTVFPNPTNGSFHLKIDPTFTDKIKSLELFNVLGEKTTNFSLNVQQDKSGAALSYTIDITTLPNGIYFLTIKTDTEMGTKKIVKK